MNSCVRHSIHRRTPCAALFAQNRFPQGVPHEAPKAFFRQRRSQSFCLFRLFNCFPGAWPALSCLLWLHWTIQWPCFVDDLWLRVFLREESSHKLLSGFRADSHVVHGKPIRNECFRNKITHFLAPTRRGLGYQNNSSDAVPIEHSFAGRVNLSVPFFISVRQDGGNRFRKKH